MADADLVMFDPDNGLEVASTSRVGARGPKYVFFDELSHYVARGQTIVVYQHAARSAPVPRQVEERLAQLKQRLPLTTEPFALVWRPVSTRAFFVASAKNHEKLLNDQTELLLAGPLGRHFARYP